MSGALRRRILLATRQAKPGCGEARGVVEDDFHHFRVSIQFEDGTVAGASGTGLRFPYTACPSAGQELERLTGMALSKVSTAVYGFTESRTHCTHMLDLAGLAVAAAARGIRLRTYDIEVPDRVDERTSPKISRDGHLVVAWDADMTTVQAPERYKNVNYRRGFATWALDNLPEDEAEAALALRRAVIISIGRTKRLDEQTHAVPTGLCFAQQPERAKEALRVKLSTLDFSERARELCAADADWIAFRE